MKCPAPCNRCTALLALTLPSVGVFLCCVLDYIRLLLFAKEGIMGFQDYFFIGSIVGPFFYCYWVAARA